MPRTLIIGYGNRDRADDGVAHGVIEALRRCLGQASLTDEDSGLEALGGQTDSVFLPQLTPELMELLCGYDRVVFVDAHVRRDVEDLYCAAVVPEYAPASLTHHLTPAMLLALVEALYARKPEGMLVSIRGCDFGFYRGLSAGTKALIGPAVDLILQWVDDDKRPWAPGNDHPRPVPTGSPPGGAK